MSSEEETIEESLKTYNLQLSQVESALLAAGKQNNEDLLKLRDDLKELISLTEESLLNLKKSRLLSMLDSNVDASSTNKSSSKQGTSAGYVGQGNSGNDMDAEFAAFQASLGDDLSFSKRKASTDSSSSSSSDEDDEPNRKDRMSYEESNFEELIGSKCRAPFSQSWGDKSHHDAMIISIGPLDMEEENCCPMVKVLFTHPIHRSMVPCQYFLENKCNFDDQCRYSHGYDVKVKDLKEYKERDHGCLTLESKCLVKYKDRVWYPAVIVDVFPDHTFKVMFDKDHEVLNVNMEDILPFENTTKSNESSSDSDDNDDSVNHSFGSDDEDEPLPVYLWRPGGHQSLDVMGGWEQHTRGIASKLMSKMGYLMGQGLGKRSEGRVEPVPIQLLPQGKSLDKIMELKALAGDRDLYDVMKKRKHHQKKVNKNAANKYIKDKEKGEKQNVFDFINKKLVHTETKDHHSQKSKASPRETSQQKKQPPAKHISERELKNKSEKGLNIQLFQTIEEIKSTEKEIQRLKSTLERNAGREPKVTNQIKGKLASMEKYLQKLQTSESSLHKHKKSRSDNKKLTVF